MVSRYIGSGRNQEGGFLALHKQDFEAHRTGGDWRHTADQINDLNGGTVQSSLGNLNILLASGLNERYRRSTNLPPGSWTYNAPGDGATITRDGYAVTIQAPSLDWTANVQYDSMLACYDAEVMDRSHNSHNLSHSGDIGFLYRTSMRHSLSDNNERNSADRPSAGFAVVNPRSTQGTTVGGSTLYTRINSFSPAGLNASGANPDQVTLSAPGYFRNSGNTAIMLGRDLLMVTFPSGAKQVYIISALVSDTVATLRTQGGATPSFSTEAVTVQWIQLVNCMGGQGDGTNSKWPLFGYYEPTSLSAAAVDEPRLTPELIGNGVNKAVLSWGYFDKLSGDVVPSGGINSSDGININGVFSGNFTSNPAGSGGGTPGGSATIDIDIHDYLHTALGRGFSNFNFQCAAPVSPVTFTLNVNASTGPTVGDRFTLFVSNVNGTALTMGWDLTKFVFASGEDSGPQTPGSVSKWVGEAVDVGAGAKYYMSRTTY